MSFTSLKCKECSNSVFHSTKYPGKAWQPYLGPLWDSQWNWTSGKKSNGYVIHRKEGSLESRPNSYPGTLSQCLIPLQFNWYNEPSSYLSWYVVSVHVQNGACSTRQSEVATQAGIEGDEQQRILGITELISQVARLLNPDPAPAFLAHGMRNCSNVKQTDTALQKPNVMSQQVFSPVFMLCLIPISRFA